MGSRKMVVRALREREGEIERREWRRKGMRRRDRGRDAEAIRQGVRARV